MSFLGVLRKNCVYILPFEASGDHLYSLSPDALPKVLNTLPQPLVLLSYFSPCLLLPVLSSCILSSICRKLIHLLLTSGGSSIILHIFLGLKHLWCVQGISLSYLRISSGLVWAFLSPAVLFLVLQYSNHHGADVNSDKWISETEQRLNASDL